MSRKIHACDFSYFVSICAPEAGPEELRTMCDWGNWVFPWDDMFDNGHLRDSLEDAERMMTALLSTFRIPSHPKTPLIEVHNSVWDRIVKDSPVGVQRRFRRAMESYCAGALEHVDQESDARLPSVEEQLAARRKSSGVTPLFALVECVHTSSLYKGCSTDLRLPIQICT